MYIHTHIYIYIFIIVSCNRPVITDRLNYAIQMGMNNGGGCIQSVCPLAHETRRFSSSGLPFLFLPLSFISRAAGLHFIKFCVYVCARVSLGWNPAARFTRATRLPNDPGGSPSSADVRRNSGSSSSRFSLKSSASRSTLDEDRSGGERYRSPIRHQAGIARGRGGGERLIPRLIGGG